MDLANDINEAFRPRDYKLADYQHELLMDEICEFEADLDSEHEIAIKLASFGQSITLAVTSIGYAIVTFHTA